MGTSKLQTAREIRGRLIRGDMMLGIMDFDDVGDMVKAYEEAGESGNAQAYLELGDCYREGIGTEPDSERAIAAYQKAITLGAGREAKLLMLRAAYFSESESLDDGEVIAMTDELLADDLDGESHLLKGYMLYKGYAYEQDLEASLQMHKEAAARGNADAMMELYVLYATGQGTPEDTQEALKWCQKAALAGSPRAMYNVAAFYMTGDGVSLAPDKAVEWYAKAAELGHGKAAATLSVMYRTGQEIDADEDKVKHFYNLAWDNGFDPDIMFEAFGLDIPEE